MNSPNIFSLTFFFLLLVHVVVCLVKGYWFLLMFGLLLYPVAAVHSVLFLMGYR